MAVSHVFCCLTWPPAPRYATHLPGRAGRARPRWRTRACSQNARPSRTKQPSATSPRGRRHANDTRLKCDSPFVLESSISLLRGPAPGSPQAAGTRMTRDSPFVLESSISSLRGPAPGSPEAAGTRMTRDGNATPPPRPGLGRSSIIFDWAPFVCRVARSVAGLENMPPDLAVRIPGRPGPGLGRSSIVLDLAPFVFRVARSRAGLEKCADRLG